MLAGFQMMMFYELNLEPVDEHTYPDALLAIWGCSCLFNSALSLLVMIISSLGLFSVLRTSSVETPPAGKERFWVPVRKEALYALDGSRPDGLIMDNGQFNHFWKTRWDRRFRRLVWCFSCTGPIFFLNLALATVTKFAQRPISGWTGFAIGILGALSWCHPCTLDTARASEDLQRPPICPLTSCIQLQGLLKCCGGRRARFHLSLVPHLTFRNEEVLPGTSWFLERCPPPRSRGRARRRDHDYSQTELEESGIEGSVGELSLLQNCLPRGSPPLVITPPRTAPWVRCLWGTMTNFEEIDRMSFHLTFPPLWRVLTSCCCSALYRAWIRISTVHGKVLRYRLFSQKYDLSPRRDATVSAPPLPFFLLSNHFRQFTPTLARCV